LAAKPEGKILLGIPRHRWEANLKMDLKNYDLVVQTGLIWLIPEIRSVIVLPVLNAYRQFFCQFFFNFQSHFVF
jgi:hypothetical protein